MITKTADTRDFRVQRAATTMRHSVTESIRQAIALGHYKAGERMPERDLCEMTGVSRTLVREALRQLESEGLVVVVAHKGPTVARITPEQAKGVYQVREVLESLAAKLFAENASDQDIARITQALDGVREAYMHGDVLDRLAAKNHFYDCLVAGTGNEALGHRRDRLAFDAGVQEDGEEIAIRKRRRSTLAQPFAGTLLFGHFPDHSGTGHGSLLR